MEIDQAMLFQTIEGAIQLGLREGAETLVAHQTTLRDQFAMAALTGLLLNTEGVASATTLAEDAYTTADAMLKASKETTS